MKQRHTEWQLQQQQQQRHRALFFSTLPIPPQRQAVRTLRFLSNFPLSPFPFLSFPAVFDRVLRFLSVSNSSVQTPFRSNAEREKEKEPLEKLQRTVLPPAPTFNLHLSSAMSAVCRCDARCVWVALR